MPVIFRGYICLSGIRLVLRDGFIVFEIAETAYNMLQGGDF